MMLNLFGEDFNLPLFSMKFGYNICVNQEFGCEEVMNISFPKSIHKQCVKVVRILLMKIMKFYKLYHMTITFISFGVLAEFDEKKHKLCEYFFPLLSVRTGSNAVLKYRISNRK